MQILYKVEKETVIPKTIEEKLDDFIALQSSNSSEKENIKKIYEEIFLYEKKRANKKGKRI